MSPHDGSAHHGGAGHGSAHHGSATASIGRLDRIEVTGIRAWGHHGVLAAEKEIGQEFAVDVVLHLSTAAAGRSDVLSRTVNYAEVAAAVAGRLQTTDADTPDTTVDGTVDTDSRLIGPGDIFVAKPGETRKKKLPDGSVIEAPSPPPLLVISSEGSAMYGTTDLATILDRKQAISPDLVLYVVDER